MDYSNKILNKDNIDVVIYHSSCSDGFGSAFSVWLYYYCVHGVDKANNITYVPQHYITDNTSFDTFLERYTGKNVLMCDFSFSYDQLIKLIDVSNSFMIIDHHITAKEDLKKLSENLKIFDMTRSAVGITWEFIFPSTESPDTWNFFFPDSEKPVILEKIPKFLEYVQDRDLWTKKYPDTEAFVTYFYEQKFDFEFWKTFLDERVLLKAIEIGKTWLEYRDILVKKIIDRSSYVIQKVDNKYSIVLYSNSPIFKSEIGNEIFKYMPLADFSCVWDYNLCKNHSYYSLRSTDDRYDVAKIAKEHGCGGHRNASGCIFNGLIGCLPYDIIPDNGITNLLCNGKIGNLDLVGINQKFVLFNVTEISDKWLETEYFDLIKRKHQDCAFIVFEKPSDSINIDDETGDIIQLREYSLFYNEKNNDNLQELLRFMAVGNKNQSIIFTSDKDFLDLFNERSGKTLNQDIIEDDFNAEYSSEDDDDI